MFRSKQVDGLLLFIAPGDESEIRALVEAKRAVVFVARVPLDIEADSVSADNAKGTEMAVTHLIGKGHRNIALLNGQSGSEQQCRTGRRVETARKRAGLPTPRNYIYHGDWTEAAGGRGIDGATRPA